MIGLRILLNSSRLHESILKFYVVTVNIRALLFKEIAFSMRGVVFQHWERLSRCALRRASNQATSALCRNPTCDLALALGRLSWQASKGSTTKATSAAKQFGLTNNLDSDQMHLYCRC